MIAEINSSTLVLLASTSSTPLFWNASVPASVGFLFLLICLHAFTRRR